MKLKFLILAVILSLLTAKLNAQFSVVSEKTFSTLRNDSEYYDDSTNEFTGTFAPLEVTGMKISFLAILKDTLRKKLFISGSVCPFWAPDCPSSGLTGVTIFKAKRFKDRLMNRINLGETGGLIEREGRYLGGDFDIVFDFEKNDRLHFYRPFSYIIEYDIGKLSR